MSSYNVNGGDIVARPKNPEKDEKTETLAIRLTPYDKQLIDRASKKEGVSISQYVMGCIYMDMLTSGDAEMMKRAITRIGGGMKKMMREAFLGKKPSEDEEELDKTT